MKILISVFLAVSISSVAMANDDDYDRCDHLEKNSRMIMELRQGTTPMKTIMKMVKETFKDSNLLDMQIAIVVAAYEQPRYSTERMKQVTIDEFANTIYLQCIKAK